MEDARLLGQTSYIYEVGCGRRHRRRGDLAHRRHPARRRASRCTSRSRTRARRRCCSSTSRDGRVPRPLAPQPRDLAPDARRDRRGRGERALAPRAGNLRLVDNGAISPKPTLSGTPHAFHLIPSVSSKVQRWPSTCGARLLASRGIGVGDSREDLGVAEHVGRFFLVGDEALAVAGERRARGELLRGRDPRDGHVSSRPLPARRAERQRRALPAPARKGER